MSYEQYDAMVARPLEASIHLLNFIYSIRHLNRTKPSYHLLVSLMSLCLLINAIATILCSFGRWPWTVLIGTFTLTYVIGTGYICIVINRLKLFSFHFQHIGKICLPLYIINIGINFTCLILLCLNLVRPRNIDITKLSASFSVISLFGVIFTQLVVKGLIGKAVVHSSKGVLSVLPGPQIEKMQHQLYVFYWYSIFATLLTFVGFTLRIVYIEQKSPVFWLVTGVLSFPIIGLMFTFDIIYHSILTQFLHVKPELTSTEAMLESAKPYVT